MAGTTIPGSPSRSVTQNLLDHQATRSSFNWKAAGSAMPGKPGAERTEAVSIPTGDVTMAGDLAIPARARGIVLFVHGSGSSRHSPRNRFVARELQQAGLATLLLDLLTTGEERVDELTGGTLRFDISLLGQRLEAASDWVAANAPTRNLSVGYFGASTGAAAALVTAARWGGRVRAVVSRGGRPDLAEEALDAVRAPTLLIVGGDDRVVIALNEDAMKKLRCERRLEIIPGATHLFEEPGALEQVSAMAVQWFMRHLN